MREIVATESRVSRLDLDPSLLSAFQDLRSHIAARGMMVWGEHCTECTYPTCYSACAYYTPRPDLHCRRFARGIENIALRGVPDPLMRIRFRKWGKLQGEGPTRVAATGTADRTARRLLFAARLLDRAPAWPRARRKLARALSRVTEGWTGSRTAPAADHFVVEGTAHGRPIPFTVTVVSKAQTGKGQFQERVVIGPGYSRAVIPVSRIAARVDLAEPFVVKIEPLEEDGPPVDVLFGIVDFVKGTGAIRPVGQPATSPPAPKASKPAAKAKCIVWDLDNTVWSGTLAEDGIDNLALRPGVADAIRALDARGILHSVASKNDEVEALAALQRFGLAEYFLFPQINWGPKSESVRRIADALDIGLDTLIFIDDQAFERSEVAETLSVVATFPDTVLDRLLTLSQCDVPVTEEAARRRLMYRDEMSRSRAFQATDSSNYEAFLRSCDITLELSLLEAANVSRIFDLSQRTNQLNISGTRYDRPAVEAMAAAPAGKLPIVMRCVDRFGDYGIIGFALVNPARRLVEDYFMSCRVQRKFIEHALYQTLLGIVGRDGATALRIRYERTQRNALALQLLSGLGFILREDAPGRGILERDLSPIAGSDIVRVRWRAGTGSGGQDAREVAG